MAKQQPAPDRHTSQLATTPEAELVRRAQLGSAAAFEQLVCSRGPSLHRYLRLELRNEADVHDALQETLTAAWRGLPTLRDGGRFWPWLVGIASNKAADVHRRRARTVSRDVLPDERVDVVLEAREALAALPPSFREVLLLRYLLGLTEEEAAVALGVRVGTVKSRSSRARKALLEELR